MSEQLCREVVSGRTDLSAEEATHLADQFYAQQAHLPNTVDVPSEELLIVGDLHGEYQSIDSVRRKLLKNKKLHFIFLGDYADRGPQQVETFNLAMAMAMTEPERVTLLRGNHESASVAKRYGFYGAVRDRYSVDVFQHYASVFGVLPLAAISSDGLFCCHGGVPEGLTSRQQLDRIDRLGPDPQDEILLQLLWNDPREGDFYFADNVRGAGTRYFGRRAFDEFLDNFGIEMMVRAHEALPEGFGLFFDGGLVSIFSASYGGSTRPRLLHLRKTGDYEILDID